MQQGGPGAGARGPRVCGVVGTGQCHAPGAAGGGPRRRARPSPRPRRAEGRNRRPLARGWGPRTRRGAPAAGEACTARRPEGGRRRESPGRGGEETVPTARGVRGAGGDNALARRPAVWGGGAAGLHRPMLLRGRPRHDPAAHATSLAERSPARGPRQYSVRPASLQRTGGGGACCRAGQRALLLPPRRAAGGAGAAGQGVQGARRARGQSPRRRPSPPPTGPQPTPTRLDRTTRPTPSTPPHPITPREISPQPAAPRPPEARARTLPARGKAPRRAGKRRTRPTARDWTDGRNERGNPSREAQRSHGGAAGRRQWHAAQPGVGGERGPRQAGGAAGVGGGRALRARRAAQRRAPDNLCGRPPRPRPGGALHGRGRVAAAAAGRRSGAPARRPSQRAGHRRAPRAGPHSPRPSTPANPALTPQTPRAARPSCTRCPASPCPPATRPSPARRRRAPTSKS
jgi:hypothetical protein